MLVRLCSPRLVCLVMALICVPLMVWCQTDAPPVPAEQPASPETDNPPSPLDTIFPQPQSQGAGMGMFISGIGLSASGAAGIVYSISRIMTGVQGLVTTTNLNSLTPLLEGLAWSGAGTLLMLLGGLLMQESGLY